MTRLGSGCAVVEHTRGLDVLFARLGEFPLLSADEEVALAQAIEADRRARLRQRWRALSRGRASKAVDRALARELLARARTALDRRAFHVLVHRFGLVDGYPWTLEEIAVELGVSRETARLDLSRALRRLRADTAEAAR